MSSDEMRRPLAVALTGGPACGKSTAAGVLQGLGVEVLDADEVAHRLMEPGGQVYGGVVEAFGKDILAGDGSIDRRKLGRRVFATEEERARLNRLVHPAVYRAFAEWREAMQEKGTHAVGMIPLLYENGREGEWDTVICIAADETLVLERLESRGLEPETARNLVRAQWPVTEKAARSPYVIWNNGSLHKFEQAVETTWKQILQEVTDRHV